MSDGKRWAFYSRTSSPTNFVQVAPCCARAPPPLRVTIDCGSKDGGSLRRASTSQPEDYSDGPFNVESFCKYIHSAIPKAIHNGKVVLVEDSDQDGFGNTHVPISMPPPQGFVPKIELPKFRVPKLKIPKFKVPNLGRATDKQFCPPRVGSPMAFTFRDLEEDSSAEKLEKFKKGVRKMLHVVKVLGQLDQYLSERTRIVVDKLSKTFAE